MTTTQFFSDIIDQLDLALDQINMNDRNFDRFAFMLIDNVTELILHRFAQDKSHEGEWLSIINKSEIDDKLLNKALGPNFDDKIKLALNQSLISEDMSKSIRGLHIYRNTAYHQGLRHEGILHSLTKFYFKIICTVLKDYTSNGWSSSSSDKISFRARKYLGHSINLNRPDIFQDSWKTLHSIVDNMDDNFVNDLYTDMKDTIDLTDDYIEYLVDNNRDKLSRDEVIINIQLWEIAFLKEGERIALEHNCQGLTVQNYINCIKNHYKPEYNRDMIPNWRKRLEPMKNSKNIHFVFDKYINFIKQSEEIRLKIDKSVEQLDQHINEEVDRMREERHTI